MNNIKMLNSKISIKLLKFETHIRLIKGAHISQISEKQCIYIINVQNNCMTRTDSCFKLLNKLSQKY
jgi:hypothetical protein